MADPTCGAGVDEGDGGADHHGPEGEAGHHGTLLL